jgi:NADH-quinone oxidoreductase subunit A
VPDQALNDFLPILLLLGFSISFAAFNLIVSKLLGKRGTTNPDKDSAFECGMKPLTPERRRFSVKFSTIAMLFILFDIEVIFIIPWAIKFRELGLLGFMEMVVFIGVLVVGWWYVVAKGALDWAPKRRPVPAPELLDEPQGSPHQS